MNGRTEIDPVTRLPLEMVEREARDSSASQEKSELLRQVGFLGVAESQAARSLIALIEERLTKRVEFLVNSDPEAKAICDILKAFGDRQFSARLAAGQLVNKFGKFQGNSQAPL